VKTQTIVIVALLGIAAYLVLSHSSQLGLGGVSETDKLRAIIGNIPPDPRFLPKPDKLSATQGVVSGATTGLAFGPIGAGVGAGAGLVASFFV